MLWMSSILSLYDCNENTPFIIKLQVVDVFMYNGMIKDVYMPVRYMTVVLKYDTRDVCIVYRCYR